MATDKVEVPVLALSQVIERLTERRIQVEKAVNTLGEAPSGLRDVFELCRGFERAFANIVNDSPSASKIKEAFFSDKGLAGGVQKLPLEKVFELESVKKLTRIADGYQPHMVSPERGLRSLAAKALEQVEAPVLQCVADVYNLLVAAAREAAAVAGENTEAAMSGKVPLNVPEFKNFIMPAVVRALEEWRRDAEVMARMMVDMERNYITAGFFRYTMARRYEHSQQQAQLQAALDKARSKGGGGIFGRKEALQPVDELTGGPNDFAGRPSSGGAGNVNLSALSNPDDYIAAYFEKKVNEDSARQSLPVDGWRFQKRFFIFSDSQRSLYYFKSPDDVPKPNGLRGQILLADCILEDLDEKGNARPTIGSAAVEMQRGDRASLLLRLRSKDLRRPLVKDHTSMTLRAPDVSTKYEWLGRLVVASGARPATPPPAPTDNGSAAAAADESRRTSDSSVAGGGPGGAPTDNGAGGHADNGYSVHGDPADAIELATAARSNSFEMLNSTRLGQGTKFFRAEDLRDRDGRLLPAPAIVLGTGPSAGGPGGAAAPQSTGLAAKLAAASSKVLSVQETWETRYEQIMEQFAHDMCVYIRMVCDTIITTVPKSVVHCMVLKAEKNLLNHMFGHVHALSEEELKRMLAEDENVVQQRIAVRALYDKVKMAIDDVQYMQEKLKRKEESSDRVTLNAEVLALASMTDLLSGDLRRRHADLITIPFLPSMRPPVPLSHMGRPNKLPAGGGGPDGPAPSGNLNRPSVQAGSGGGAVPRRAPPSAPGAAARRAPPPPPPK